MKPFRVNLSVAILTSLAALLLLSWLLLSIISFTTARKDLVAQKNEQARILLATFVSALPPRLQLPADSEPTPAGRISATFGRERDFLDLLVTDANGASVFYTTAKSNRPSSEKSRPATTWMSSSIPESFWSIKSRNSKRIARSGVAWIATGCETGALAIRMATWNSPGPSSPFS